MGAAFPEEASPGSRITGLMARFLGVGFIAYLAVSVSGIAEGAQILAWWWTPAAVVLIFVPGIGLLVVTFVAPTWISATGTAAALGIPLASALWFLAWDGEILDNGVRGTWMSAFSGIAGLCAALTWRPGVTLTVQFVSTTSVATIDQLGLFGQAASVADVVYAGLWAFGFATLLASAVIMALRTGSVLDATRESLERSIADAAAAQAREQEKSRFDALIHDRVLTTLLASSRPTADGRLAAEARSAIAELTSAAEDRDGDGRVSAASLAQHLTSIVDYAGSTVDLSITVGDHSSEYPGEVLSAICGAAAEALRNSITHAGRGAERRVVVELDSDAVRVDITDTGRGFDTTAPLPGRLGIEGSILRRMTALAGGSARISSRLGEGTTVDLEWMRPR